MVVFDELNILGSSISQSNPTVQCQLHFVGEPYLS